MRTPVAAAYEWQTVVLWGMVICLIAIVALQFHRDRGNFRHFSLADLVVENGRVNLRKWCEFGAWVTWSVVMIIQSIRGTVTVEMMFAYGGTYAASRLIGQGINSRADTEVRKAALGKGIDPNLAAAQRTHGSEPDRVATPAPPVGPPSADMPQDDSNP